MTRISVEDAQVGLPDLIARLQPGEEVQITKDDQPIARLVAETARPRKPRQPGTAIGRLTIVEEDQSHLDDFRKYVF
jgi:antitoxin (DNA-binding transcriptional repressor) of toxin-antitoxin stability system